MSGHAADPRSTRKQLQGFRMRTLLITLAVSGALVALAWPLWSASRSRNADGPPTVTVGPFTIETQVRKISTGRFPNISANPFEKMEVTGFVVRHDGRKVAIPVGRGEQLDRFWEAKVLSGAPRPALLVGETGVTLLSDREGQLEIRELVPPGSDTARLQWLDSLHGQPGPEQLVTIRDTRDESRRLEGGRLLLVNRRVVLDVATLESFAFEPYDSVEQIQPFTASHGEAHALSPDGRQLVVHTSHSTGEYYRNALLAIDYRANRAYAAPFENTPTRFHGVESIDPAWFAHYFEWRDDGADGLRLALREGVAPRPWTGRLIDFGGGMVEYRIKPVESAMLALLAAHVERDHAAQRLPGNDPDRIELRTGDVALSLRFDPADREASLYAGHGPTAQQAYRLIEAIGAGFDRELSDGRHDALFGSLDPP